MPRIRVGLVGLSTSSTQAQWAAKAHLPYLQSAHGQERYELVALCNTSHDSAKKSIEEYKLPSSTKTFDSPAKLAADPDVELIVNVTGVDKHHEILLPVLKAGKNVFTELPLASNIAQMEELMENLEKAKVNNVFGMQGQTHPVPKLVKEILAQGKIGKVLSSTWTGASGPYFGGGPMPVGVKAFTDRKVGANFMSVLFLHTINYVMSTLGEVDTFQSILGNQRPSVDLIDPSQGGKLVETVQKDTPDQILFQGRFGSGALFSYHLRGGEPFPGEKGLVWSIYGEKGEIRITNPVCMLDIMHAGVEIKLQESGKEGAEAIELPKDDLSDLPHPAQNVGRIYAAYASGNKGGEGGYPDWKVGMKRHRLLEAMWKQSDGSQPFGASF